MEHNLTSGSVFKNILYFSLPYFLSYFLQTLYGMADLFLIGRFCGVADITAVSIGSQIMHMLTVMIVGLAMGTTVMIGQNIGGGNKKGAAAVIGNSVSLFMLAAFALLALLLIFVKPIAAVMSTPDEAMAGTTAYLTICFAGVPFITAYNIISSILRGMGDSKSPMYFIALACIMNIALDLIFIGVMRLGPAGAAFGTTISQTISVITALVYIKKSKNGISISKKDFKPSRSVMGRILKVGVPVSLQDGFIQIAFIIITIIANRRGLDDAAAVGIVEKIIGILFLVPSSMLSSVSALAAQNIGAKKYDRAQITLRYAICFTVGIGVIISTIIEFIPGRVVGLFTEDAVVTMMGAQYLSSYVWDCVFAGVHFCFSGYFCACGRSGLSFLHNVISIVFVRVPGAYIASKLFADTLFPMGIAAPLGSLLSVIVCVIAYEYVRRCQKNASG